MRHVALVGMMGSGKSTVGRRVAAATGRRFVDLDDEIVARDGRPIPDIFSEDGEAAFRRTECDVLAAALEAVEPSVIATGGGVVTTERCRDLLADADVVWLRAEARSLASRVGDGQGRPLLAGGDPVAVVEKLERERSDLYGAVADLTVDTDELALDEVATLVVQRLGSGAAR